jgi:hypothetical protein
MQNINPAKRLPAFDVCKTNQLLQTKVRTFSRIIRINTQALHTHPSI